eukprot:gene25764-32253_t
MHQARASHAHAPHFDESTHQAEHDVIGRPKIAGGHITAHVAGPQGYMEVDVDSDGNESPGISPNASTHSLIGRTLPTTPGRPPLSKKFSSTDYMNMPSIDDKNPARKMGLTVNIQGPAEPSESEKKDRRQSFKQEQSFQTPRNAAIAAAKAKVEAEEKDLNIYDLEEGKQDSDDEDSPTHLGGYKRKKSIFNFLQTKVNDKSLHSLERHSQGLTGLGTVVKLNKAKTFTDKFDYVIVFPYEDGQQSADCRMVIHTMLGAGLELFPYLSIQEDELIVMFRAPIAVLKEIADKSDFKMLLDPAVLEMILTAGNPEFRIAPLRIRHDPTITPILPYEHIFWKLHPSTFPSHDMSKCNELLEICTDPWVMPWQFPHTLHKDYLGEKIALYNVFMGHMSYWLTFPSTVGVIFQLLIWYTGDYSHPVLAFFSVLVT